MPDINIKMSYSRSTTSNTLFCGNINFTQQSPNSIICPPGCDYSDMHFTLNSKVTTQFKKLFQSSPVLPKSYTLYDQSGFKNCVYSENRTTNNPGTINNSLDDKVLLSDINLPSIVNGQQFLVLSSYIGLTSRTLESQKRHLITEDMKIFSSKYDLSRVILFIVDKVETEISCFCNLNTIFKEVHIIPHENIVSSLVEYTSGSCVSGSKPDFQGMLNFGQNIEIVTCHFKNINPHGDILMTDRRNGRIHISSNSTQASVQFVIMLSHSYPLNIYITETTTDAIIDLKIIPDTSNCLSEYHLQIMMDSILYMDKIDKFDNRALIQYFLTDEQRVVKYLFSSPIQKEFKLNDNHDTFSIDYMIISYILNVNKQIRHKIISNTNSDEESQLYLNRGRMFDLDTFAPPPPQPLMRVKTEA